MIFYCKQQAYMCSNSLIIAHQVMRILTGVLLRLTKRPLPWVLLGVPITILGQGLLIRFKRDAVLRTACIVAARVLIGAGRALYHTAALVAVQADVPESELSTATALFLALMTVGSSIGKRYFIVL